MFTVRGISQTFQWVMTLYASDPDTIISPTVIIIFGSMVFVFALLDISIDVLFPREHRDRSTADNAV